MHVDDVSWGRGALRAGFGEHAVAAQAVSPAEAAFSFAFLYLALWASSNDAAGHIWLSSGPAALGHIENLNSVFSYEQIQT